VERPSWAPEDIDLNQPSIARVYDYYLGGFHNFAADRAVVEKTLQILPESPLIAHANRAFLSRAVRFCLDAGVTQFLDIGSGIPTVGNVHEVAQQADPRARVVYVDIDPVAVSHSRAILAGNPRADVVQADLHEPEQILKDSRLLRLLDLDKPVALLMVAVLHFVPEVADPAGVIDRYRRALPAGSFLVISHASEEGLAKDRLDAFRELYDRAVARLTFRSQLEVEALFGGFELVRPGVVAMDQWRPDPASTVDGRTLSQYGFAGVGRSHDR
jgi:SAM-dependent methyltransferase